MSERAVAAALHNTERIIAHYVLSETNAARAENASLVIQHNARAEIDPLGLVNFLFHEAAGRLAVIDRVFL